MDLTSGIMLARIRGIAIRVHWSWIFIFTLLTWALATGFFEMEFEEWTSEQRWLAAAGTAVLFFTSVLLHELSHAFVALAYKMKVPSITLFIFGGVSNIEGEMESPRQEFRIAIAGPIMSALLAVIFIVVGVFVPWVNLGIIFIYLGFVNGLLAVFNLLPGFPLDGGRVLRSLLWRRTNDLTEATRIASRVGSGIAWFMIAGGIAWVLFIGFTGLWYVLIGLFLKSAAEGSYSQVLIERTLRGINASEVMSAPPEPLPETVNLQVIVDERVLARGERAIFLDREGRVTGLITTTDLARVPRNELPQTSASSVMVQTGDIVTVGPETSVMEAMRLMTEKDIHQVPVISGSQMVGLLTRANILQQIETRMRFSGDGVGKRR